MVHNQSVGQSVNGLEPRNQISKMNKSPKSSKVNSIKHQNTK